MLHILLLILKIAGVIILSLIGVFLLIILLLIFTPLRYELMGNCNGNLDSLNFSARLSFFVRLIRIHIQYQENRLVWRIHLLWKYFSNENDSSEEVFVPFATAEKNANTQTSVIPEEKKRENPKQAENASLLDSSSEKQSVEHKNVADKTSVNKTDRTSSQEQETKIGFTERIAALIEKLKYTSSKICDIINILREKTDEVTTFLTNKTHKSALQKLLLEIKRLFKKLKPQKIKCSIIFGFEDPSVTGKVLGGISILYPDIQDNVTVTADFEEKKLFGDLYIRGIAKLSMFLSFLLHLILNKKIRITLSHIFKLIKTFRQGGQ